MTIRFAVLMLCLVAAGGFAMSGSACAADEHDTHSAADGDGPGPGGESGDHSAHRDEHAAHGDGRDWNKPPLYFSLQLFLFTLVLLGLYFFSMKQMAWQPIIDGLNQREARIQKAEQDAASAKAEAAQFEKKADERLAQVHIEVKELIDKARVEADAKKLEIVSNAEQEATRIKEQALAEIAGARQQAIDELNANIGHQASLVVKQVSEGSVN